MASKTAVWTKSLISVPCITQADVDKWADTDVRIPRSKQQKGYSNWIEGYIHDVEVRHVGDNIQVKAKSFPSMRKNVLPYKVQVSLLTEQPLVVKEHDCDCKAGNSYCSHQIGLLYLLCHYKKMAYKAVPPVASKTSLPQTWNIPQRSLGIVPHQVDKLEVCRIKPPKRQSTSSDDKSSKKRIAESVVSNLYCPVQQPIPARDFASQLLSNLQCVGTNAEIIKQLPGTVPPLAISKFGPVPQGSVLSYQQKLSPKKSVNIINNNRVMTFPPLPLPPQPATYSHVLDKAESVYYDGLQVSRDTAIEIEKQTSLQSASKTWYDMRAVRVTSSQFKHVCSRKTDFDALASRFASKKTIQTQAMKYGIDQEPHAAKQYSDITGNNTYMCGFVINPDAPHLGTSPNRTVYDPTSESAPYGLLEIKCPSVNSFTECSYLKPKGSSHELKKSHEYFYQAMGQMGVTGLPWCDFMVRAREDFHLERIHFDHDLWVEMKEKLDIFFFNFFVYKCMK